ncbi:sodium/mannose cotransporter SLC5A10-like isoform X1 [Scylla paramamosain]|uniref:sodium/mannose cotransporter SLC5A10-like isoform X1 n=1 Tax=Scylla paramamosain TaxID=85552 RepID=UPI003082D35E
MTHSETLLVWDYVAIIGYFSLNLLVGGYALCRPNRGTISGYFLAGRFMGWFPIGASLMATNIGSEHFIGLSGSGAASGIGIGAFNFNPVFLLPLMCWVFLPVYIASGVCTVPEYMKKRFGGQRIQMYLAFLSLLLYIFTKISVDLYTGAIFINQALKWDIYGSMLALLALTALFTVTGGLVAVIYSDTLQLFIMLGGASFIMVRAFQEVGGYEALQYKYMQAIPKLTYENTTCGLPRDDAWIMLRHPVKSDLPWPAFILGQTPASIWYWCADQVMIQRVLAAKSLSHAKGGTVFAAYIKILPFFLFLIPGMISRALYPDDVACVLPEECMRACGSRSSCFNSAYPRLLVGILPVGFKGIMLAVILAALMSDLTSIFNSASAMFTLDLWPFLRPKAGIKELLIVGKVFSVVVVALSVAWVPIIEKVQSGQLFVYIQRVGAYLAPPIAAVYLLAVFWKRMNEKGAFWALMMGLFVGLIRLILDFSHPPPSCNEDEYRPLVIQLNFMYFAMILFWITVLTAVVVSLFTEPPESFRVIRTTYFTRLDENIRDDEEPDVTSEITLEDAMSPLTHDEETITEKKKESHLQKAKRCYMWLCGLQVSQHSTKKLGEPDYKQALISLKEDPFVKKSLNICLVILLAVGVFLYTYFSVNPFPENVNPREHQV